MKRPSKKVPSRPTGNRKRPSIRRHIDKSRIRKQLRKHGGKKSDSQTTSLRVSTAPAPASTALQESTACRLTARGLLYQLDSDFSRSWAEQAQVQALVNPHQGPHVNVFRHQLHRMRSSVAFPRDVAEKITDFIDVAAKAFFVEEQTFLLQDLLLAMRPSGDSGTIDKAYHALVSSGHILVSATGMAGKGMSPHAFDLHSARPFRYVSSLHALLEAFEASSPPDRQLAATYQAVRVIGGLRSTACRSAVLVEARKISETHFFSLPAALRHRLQSASLSKKTRQNLMSALRHLITWGLRQNRFALWFPEYRPSDAWTALVDECFPIALRGPSHRLLLNCRSSLEQLFRVARDEVGVSQPSALTALHIERCLEIVAVPHRTLEAKRIRRFPSPRHQRHGNWNHPVIRLIVDTLFARRKKPALPYLSNRVDASVSEYSLDGFSALIRFYGLPEAWVEFYSWYSEYSSISHVELRKRRDEFPARGAVRELMRSTFEARFGTARAFLGVARELYPERFCSLTPTAVFGELFEQIALDMMDRWESRAAEKTGPSHGASAGIVHHIIIGGLTARALFDRSVHLRKRGRPREASDDAGRGRGTMENTTGLWLSGGLTADETALLSAYEMSRQDSSALQRQRRTSPHGTKLNTVKDLRQLIRDTPFVHFQRAHLWILAHVAALRAMGMESTPEYATWITVALTNGLLVSGGCRRGELCHLRMGVQTMLLRGDRTIKLRPVDRKNRRVLSYVARERWIPHWLIDSYSEDVRPQLLAKAGLSKHAHQFLILSPTNGRPYGCLEETVEDGTNRLNRPFASRKALLAALWMRHVALAFVKCEFLVPSGPQRFGMHILRNVGGHAVYRKHGLEAAAAWLGDTVAAVEGTYASLEGEEVDTSLVD